MTPDAALDRVAFLVGLRLMGPDARRRLRLALARSPDLQGAPGFDVDALERLDALLDGRREPETTQDHYDLARAERERASAPFSAHFWLARVADLIGAGFTAQEAAQLVATVQARLGSEAQSPEMHRAG